MASKILVRCVRLSAFVFIASMAACGGGGGGSSEPAAAAPAQKVAPICTVVLYGDSIMRGEAAITLDSRPAATLKRIRPAYTIEDRSVGGETAETRAATFNNEYRPQRIVVIQHAVNDMLQGKALAPALNAMVGYAKAEGRTVIVTGVSYVNDPRLDATRALVAKVAADNGVIYADWPSVKGDVYDHIHPDQAYSDALVAKLAEAMDRALPECAQF
jgi:hypothetical protein